MARPIYLDHNATTPLLPEVAEAMRDCGAETSLNPASQHQFGRQARRLVEGARERIGELLGADMAGPRPDRVVFTSGGTEANNLALFGRVDPVAPQSAHLVVSAIEHPSVVAAAEHLEHRGCRVDRLEASPDGVVRVDRLGELLRAETRLVAVMLGNNETGVLQPVAELAAICNQHGVPLHTDAAQVAGKLPIDFRGLGVATLAVAAHKFHGPVGIGALVVQHGEELRPQLFGGFQQGGLRPGTEPVSLVVGMCRALEIWQRESGQRAARMRMLRDRLEGALVAGWPAAVVVGCGAPRLPHVTNIALVGHDRQALFMALDQAGVACSTGSACASGSSEQSPVLLAMGCEKSVVSSALRLSLGAATTADEVDEAARRILRCCNDLRQRKEG